MSSEVARKLALRSEVFAIVIPLRGLTAAVIQCVNEFPRCSTLLVIPDLIGNLLYFWGDARLRGHDISAYFLLPAVHYFSA